MAFLDMDVTLWEGSVRRVFVADTLCLPALAVQKAVQDTVDCSISDVVGLDIKKASGEVFLYFDKLEWVDFDGDMRSLKQINMVSNRECRVKNLPICIQKVVVTYRTTIDDLKEKLRENPLLDVEFIGYSLPDGNFGNWV